MSTFKKVERASWGLSVTKGTVGAALSVLLGALIGVGALIVAPVERVRELPVEMAEEQVFFVEGSRSGGQYPRKGELLLDGRAAELTLAAADLNAWIAASVWSVSGGSAAGLLMTQSLNFRLVSDQLQIGVPSILSELGWVSWQVILQARGGFERKGGGVIFVVEEFKVGGRATERFPGLALFLAGRLMKTREVPEEVLAEGDGLREVRVIGNGLVLTLP